MRGRRDGVGDRGLARAWCLIYDMARGASLGSTCEPLPRRGGKGLSSAMSNKPLWGAAWAEEGIRLVGWLSRHSETVASDCTEEHGPPYPLNEVVEYHAMGEGRRLWAVDGD
ncbi:hypothetical protein AMTR_s00072p00163640 [Amborella trichopoda]|uniref:Uncharacterized protein n=1 Tax=Amborella trichopoda TaxID=13333 RepID=W1NUY3_AMBTC|nr:hypothetical protein AMTR_s00072p00163640 [Amborella trichopoda]